MQNNPVNWVDPTGLEWWDPKDWSADDIWDETGGKAVSYVDDHIGEIGTAIGCGVGVATAEMGVGLLLAGATCTTAIGLQVVGERRGDSVSTGRGGALYGCGVGLLASSLNPISLLAAGNNCVLMAGLQAASERHYERDAINACEPDDRG